jgi:hypothetical protein
MLEVARKIVPLDPSAACVLYASMLEVIETGNHYQWDKDSFVDYAILKLDMNDYDGCFAAFDRAKRVFLDLENWDNASYCVCAKISISLERHDIVAAQRFLAAEIQEDYFISCPAFEMISFVVRGVTQRDPAILERGQRHFAVSYLKPAIARIICGFTCPSNAGDVASADDDSWLS